MAENEESSTLHKTLKHRDEIKAMIPELIEHALREISIFAPTLDGHLFNTTEVAEKIASFAAGHSRNRIKILVEDSRQVLRHNERIIEVHRRLSDLIPMHVVSENHTGLSELFIVVDKSGFLYQGDIHRHEAVIDFTDKIKTVQFYKRFNKMWEQSSPVRAFGGLGI